MNIANTMLWMKKNAYEETTIKKVAKLLRHLQRNSNFKDPEAVKLYIANEANVTQLVLTHFDADVYRTMKDREQARVEARNVVQKHGRRVRWLRNKIMIPISASCLICYRAF